MLILLTGILYIVCGGLILIGFLTPFAGSLIFLASLIGAFFSTSFLHQIFESPVIYTIFLSAAIVLLGPGAFSIDSILFGRREIFIPKN